MNKKNLLFLLMLMPIMASADESGTCGNNLIWSYVDATKTLTISGTGPMTDYSYISDNKSSAPWNSFKSSIQIAIIESGVTSIGSEAFYDCSGLTSVTIPNSVTSIGDWAFRYCSGLTSVTIPNSVTSIGWYAFDGCSGLTSVTIPNSVTSIGFDAFRDCSGLTSITIPNSVTSIGEYAFFRCSGLTTITIPNSVTSIGRSAFSYCSGLTSITIPNSVTSIGEGAFSRCSGLTSIKVESGNNNYDSRNNCNAIIEKSSNTLITGCQNTIIPNSVTSIGDEAFYNCSGLTSITISNSVTSIGEDAFYNCSGLTTIVSEIETPFALYSVFSYYGTATLIVPPGKKSVYQNTAGWKKFTNIVEAELMGYEFENSGIRYKIGENNTVSVVSRAEKYSGDVVIPSQVSYHGSNYDVTAIGPSAFEGCVDMTSVTIPSSVTTIGGAAFYYCTGLTTVDIPNGATTIGEGAFSKCEGLTSVTIPGSVTTIDSNAFFQCYALTQITSWIENPFVINSNVFPTSVYSNATLNVPSGKKTVYQNTSGWKKFENMSESSKCAKPIISYSNGKISFSCETEGVEFHYTISNTNSSTGVGSSVNFSPTVNISVYASKSGFANSDTSTAEIVVPAGLRGDLTGDGQVNVADHVELSKIILGQ